MAINSNVDFVNTFDRNALCVSTRILMNIAPHEDEHAAQTIALEMLRVLLATGMTPAQYNLTTEAEYQAFVNEARTRGKFNINAPVPFLSEGDVQSAANVGGNYFEHGYDFIMNGISQGNKITFTRIGGV